ncbi:MAG: type II toxin-antitoxin system VapC family toxin [Chloroflexaceae bacterium]|nr:type II toxin-antitoxin system VapC family toxin [Chloroflexaceae bacterium]
MFDIAKEALGHRVYVFGLVRQRLHGPKINIEVEELGLYLHSKNCQLSVRFSKAERTSVIQKPLHYLDSCIFTGFLNVRAEPEIFRECEPIIRAAEQGVIRAFTSAFTMGEVVYVKAAPGEESLSLETQEKIISQLLASPWLEKVSFEPDMAEINRFLLREYGASGKKGLKPYDSVHLATAIRMKVDYFDTIDEELMRLLPKSICCPPRYPKPLILQRPLVENFQLKLL